MTVSSVIYARWMTQDGGARRILSGEDMMSLVGWHEKSMGRIHCPRVGKLMGGNAFSAFAVGALTFSLMATEHLIADPADDSDDVSCNSSGSIQ